MVGHMDSVKIPGSSRTPNQSAGVRSSITLFQMISLFSAAVRAMYSALLTSWKAWAPVRQTSREMASKAFMTSDKTGLKRSHAEVSFIKIIFIFLIRFFFNHQ